MMLFRRLACLAVLSGSLLPLQAATPLVNLASENAPVILTVHDMPSLLAQWDQSPWAKTWNDEQVKRFFAPLRAKWKVDDWSTKARDKTGYTLNELLAFATGDAIIVASDLDFTSAKEPNVLIGLEVGENASKIEEVIAKLNKDADETEEVSDFSGVAVHLAHSNDSKPDDKDPHTTAWAIFEGKFLASLSKETVFSAIDAIKSGGVANPWGKSERFAQLQQRTGETHLSFVVNVEAIYPAIKAAMEAKKKSESEPTTGPFGVDPQTLLPALGIDAWRDFYASVRLRDDSTEMRGGLTYSEARGIIKLLAYHEGPPQIPAFVSAKWVSVSTSRYSVKEAFAAVEEILENFSPAISGLVQGQIRSSNKKLGIDLKRDLIGSLGDTVVAANTISPNAPAGAQPSLTDFEQIFAVSLENQDVFTNAIEAVKRSLGPQADTLFITRDYLGQKIFTFKSPSPAQKGFSYAIAKGYVFVSVGSAAPIEAALQGLAGNQPSLWEKPEVSAAFAQLPSSAMAFQYQDVRAMIGSLFKTLSTAAGMMNNAGAPVAGPEADDDDDAAPAAGPKKVHRASSALIDPSAAPDSETIAKYWSHSWGYGTKDSTGVHGSSQIVYPK